MLQNIYIFWPCPVMTRQEPPIREWQLIHTIGYFFNEEKFLVYGLPRHFFLFPPVERLAAISSVAHKGNNSHRLIRRGKFPTEGGSVGSQRERRRGGVRLSVKNGRRIRPLSNQSDQPHTSKVRNKLFSISIFFSSN